MLRTIRIILAALCFAAICLLFADTSGIFSPSFAFMAKAQLVPAILAGSAAAVAAIMALTLVFGRLYCSVLCPLGVLQDIMGAGAGNYRFRHAPPHSLVRVIVLIAFVLSLAAGVPLAFSLVEPYSAFGRMAADLLAPVWGWGTNALAWASERAGNYDVASTMVWQKGFAALAAAVATFGVIGLMAWKWGRLWCNTICPVGTVLGFLSRFSLLRPRIDKANCKKCGLCAKVCKSACIEAETGTIDASRCVACFNCLNACRHNAVSYGPSGKKNVAPAAPPKKTDALRRGLLASLAGLVVPGGALGASRGTTIPALTRKLPPERQTPVTPPGAGSLQAFAAHCTGCQLCVAACPNQVLRAADAGSGMLQPTMAFERGYCRVNCTTCSTVCPSGAIRPITAAEKSATQIGRAVIDLKRCITGTDNVACSACARICPPGVINLVGPENAPKKPVVDAERCTGCGACEYVCPARPVAAIHVEGNREHRRI